MREVWMEQENPDSAITAKARERRHRWEAHGLWWTEASIWTDRMVSALGNGVRGGKRCLLRGSRALHPSGSF